MELQPSRRDHPSFKWRRFVLSIFTVCLGKKKQPLLGVFGFANAAGAFLLKSGAHPPRGRPADGCNFFYGIPVTIDSIRLSCKPVELRWSSGGWLDNQGVSRT